MWLICCRIVEPPAKIVSVMLMNRLGRRTLFCSGLIISGCFCLITGFVPSGIHDNLLTWNLNNLWLAEGVRYITDKLSKWLNYRSNIHSNGDVAVREILRIVFIGADLLLHSWVVPHVDEKLCSRTLFHHEQVRFIRCTSSSGTGNLLHSFSLFSYQATSTS